MNESILPARDARIELRFLWLYAIAHWRKFFREKELTIAIGEPLDFEIY